MPSFSFSEAVSDVHFDYNMLKVSKLLIPMNTIKHLSKNNPGAGKLTGGLVRCFRGYLAATLFLTLGLAGISNVEAGTYTSVASGAWGSASTWSPGGVPTATDDVIINGHYITVNAAAAAGSLTLNGSALGASAVSINSGILLNVSGAVVVNAAGADGLTNLVNIGNGNLTALSLAINGAATGTKQGSVQVSAGTLDVRGNVTFSSPTNTSLALNDAGSFKLGGILSSNGTFTAVPTATLYLNGTSPQTMPAHKLPKVVIQNPAGVTQMSHFGSGDIGDLTVSVGSYNTNGLSLQGGGNKLTVENLAIFRVPSGGSVPNGFGTMDLKSNSEFIYEGGNQTIGAYTYGKLTLKGAGSVKAPAGNIVINNNFTIESGVTLNMLSRQVSGPGKGILSGILKTSHPSGVSGSSGTFLSALQISSGSTIEYYGGNQFITARNDYSNIIISGGGEKFLTGNLKISSVLTVESGSVLNLATHQISSANSASQIIVNGTIRTSRVEGFSGATTTSIHSNVSPVTLANGSTVDYCAALASGDQIVTSRTDYKKIMFSNSMTKKLSGNIVIADTLTVANGALLQLDAFKVMEAAGATAVANIQGTIDVLNVNGLANKTTSAFHSNVTLLPLGETSNIIYSATAPQIVTAMNYGGLNIKGAAMKTLEGSVIVRNSLYVNEGASLEMGNNMITPGVWTINRPYIAINGLVKTTRQQGLSGSNQTNISSEFEDVWLNPYSTVVYNGASQYVSGRLDYGKVVLEGTGTKILLGNTAINTELNLNTSSLSLGNNNLTMAATSVISNASPSSYIIQNGTGKLIYQNLGDDVDGYSGEVLFPVGTASSYTPAYLSNAGSTNSFSVLVTNGILGNDGLQAGYGVVNKTWDIHQESTNGPVEVAIRLQWNAADELVDFDRTKVAVSHYKDGAGAWNWEGSFVPAAGSGPFTASASGITTFSPFGVGSPLSPLPVELVYFKVSKQGEAALLEWETASEKNNQGFEIQASADGRDFQRVGFVETRNGNSSSVQDYTYRDAQNSKTGLWYYRIKQTDTDGSVSYYGPKVIDFGRARNLVSVYPNPFTDKFEIKVQAAAAAEATITLHDLSGKLVYSGTEKLNTGINHIEVTTGDQYPAGLYVLTAKAGGQVFVTRIVKQ